MAESGSLPPALKIPAAGLLSWILPGLGHIFVGDHKRGLIILLTIATTFWGGIAIGGVRETVHPQKKKLWFIAQVCNGSHALIAYRWGLDLRARPSEQRAADANWQTIEVGVVYTGVAGLLSVLVILDALMRADPTSRPPAPQAGSRGGGSP